MRQKRKVSTDLLGIKRMGLYYHSDEEAVIEELIHMVHTDKQPKTQAAFLFGNWPIV